MQYLRPLLAALLLLPPAHLRAQSAVEVQVTPAQLRLKVGQRERLFLSAYDADGNLLASPTFTFAATPSGVVRVEGDGTVVAVGPGTARIEASSGTGKAAVSVTVAAPPPPKEPEPVPVLPAGARLVVSPESVTLLRLESSRVTMSLVVPGGSGLPQLQGSWRSTDPSVATVDDAGEVKALHLGSAQLVATGPGGLTAAVQLEVREDSLAAAPGELGLPVGATDSIRTFVPAQGGRPVTFGLAWRSSDPTVARVNNSGTVFGMSPGEAMLTLIGYGQQRTVRVTVHPPADRLRIAPAPGQPIRLTLGGSAPIYIQALAADSTPLSSFSANWEVADTTVAAFDASERRLHARGIGRTTLTMVAHAFEPTIWEVEVTAGGLAFARSRFRLAPGGQDTLAASLVDGEGLTTGPAAGLVFDTSRPEVVSVSADGVVTAGAVGASTITARTAWGTAATAEVFVTKPMLVTLRRAAGTDLVQLDSTGAPSLVPLVADGNAHAGAVWSPDGTRIAFAATVNGNTDIYVADAAGRGVTRLTTDAGEDREPAWSPDGGTIAFTSLRTGAPQVWAMNADGTGLRQLTDGAGANSSPVYRRDGRIIAFISTRDGNPDLFEMGSEGADPRAITRTPEPESRPAYFANGDLAVVVERPGRGDILRIRAGDGQRIMLQSVNGRVTALAVEGDGSRIAFATVEPGAAAGAPAVTTFRLKTLVPDTPPVVVPLEGEVLSVSFQGSR